MSEADLLSFALKYLTMNKIVHWRMPLGAVMRTIGKKIIHCPSPVKGMPDICGILPSGRFFGIELKSLKGKMSPEQLQWNHKINNANGLAVVIKTEDELINFVAAIKNVNMVTSINEITRL